MIYPYRANAIVANTPTLETSAQSSEKRCLDDLQLRLWVPWLGRIGVVVGSPYYHQEKSRRRGSVQHESMGEG